MSSLVCPQLSPLFRIKRLALFLSLACTSAYAHSEELDLLMSMSLEELSNVDISMTSAAKKEQSISDIPAAAYVITNEMIRRSGVRSVAEALALAPGVQVTRIAEYNWQVSLRGVNEVLFNKLLVMVDGRSVYSPLMSGSFWHTIDTMLEDIERIEIIRGTAGTMWGGNAANGVVNIITKNSQETQGHFVEVAHGERSYQELNYRYGTTFNDKLTARAYVKGLTGDYYSMNDDLWRNLRGGIRADYEDEHRQFTFQIGGYHTKSDHYWYYADFYNDPADVFTYTTVDIYSRGAYASFDWYEQTQRADYELHVWADTNSTNEPSAQGEFYTFDVDALARIDLNDRHELTTGGGVRVIHRRFEDYPDDLYSYVEPWGRFSNEPTGTDVIVNSYAQLESQLTDKLTTTLGAKVEYFSLNDTVEFQPQARLLYKHSQKQQFWAGAGRAVVTPSFVDTKTDSYFLGTVEITDGNGNIVATAPGVIFTEANEDLKNESVVTLDVGHRFSPTPTLNIDSTLFYSQYNNTRMEGESAWDCTFGNCSDGSTLPNGLFTLIENYSDGLDVENYGFETAIRWTPFESLTLNTSYSYIQTEATCSNHYTCDIDAPAGIKTKYNSQPAHLVSVQSLWNFAPGWQLDLWYKHKSTVDTDSPYYKESSLSTMDLRLAWQHQPTWPRLELVVDGFGESSYSELQGKAPVEETVYFKASWNIQ